MSYLNLMLPRAVIIGMTCNDDVLNWCASYLDIAKEHLVELELLIHAVESADPRRSPYVRFPFVTKDSNGFPVNWYIGYDGPSLWHRFKKKFGFCDDLVAVSFRDGQATLHAMIAMGIPKHKLIFNLADANALTELGKRIFKLLV